VIVQFDKEIFRAENVPIFGRALFRLLDVVCLNCGVDFARETATEPDQSFRMGREKFLIDPRRVMKTIEVRGRDQLHEIPVARLVLRQQREVIRCIAPRSGTVFVRSRSNISFATNDRFHSSALRFLVKFNRPKQIAVISDCNCGHLEFSCFFHQLFHPDGAIQQRVFRVQVQMNERVASHQFSV
jgi:hypothetical protein